MGFYVNDFGNVFGDTFVTPVGRLQFPSLVAPKEYRGKTKFGATLLFPKATENEWISGFSLIEENINAMCAQVYPNGTPAFKYPMLRDGDEEKYAGFPGTWCIKTSASAADRVACYDINQRPIDPAVLMAGMLVRAVVQVGLFENGVSYKLKAVQLIKDDGVRYSGAPDPASFLGEAPIVGIDSVPAPAPVAAPVASVAAAPVIAPAAPAAPVARPAVAPVAPARPVGPQSQTRPAPSAAAQGVVAQALAPRSPAAAPMNARQAAPSAPAVTQQVQVAKQAASTPPGRGLAGVAKLNGMI